MCNQPTGRIFYKLFTPRFCACFDFVLMVLFVPEIFVRNTGKSEFRSVRNFNAAVTLLYYIIAYLLIDSAIYYNFYV